MDEINGNVINNDNSNFLANKAYAQSMSNLYAHTHTYIYIQFYKREIYTL